MRLEDVDVLGPGADAQPFAQQSQQVESRLVLKHVDAVGERRDAASRSHDVVSCDEIVLAVVAVVAGVEDHEAGIRGDGFDLFEDDARAQVGDRVETEHFGLLGPVVPRGIESFLRGAFGGRFPAAAGTAGQFAQAALHLGGGIFGRFHIGRPRKVLPVGHSVFVEDHHVHVVAADLADERLLDEGLHRVTQEFGVVGAAEHVAELLVEQLLFIAPGDERIGVGAVARVGDELVERRRVAVFGHGFLQVTGNLFVGIAVGFLRLDAARIDVAGDVLRRIGRHFVIMKQSLRGSALRDELQIEIVEKAVRRNRGFVERVVAFVHFEGRGEVLRLGDHGDGHVADEYASLQSVFRIKFAQDVTHLFGRRPVVRNDVNGQSFGFERLFVGCHLGPAFPGGSGVGDHGEGTRSLYGGVFERLRSSRRGRKQQNSGQQDKKRFSIIHMEQLFETLRGGYVSSSPEGSSFKTSVRF